MHIVIFGGNAAEKIKQHILETWDYIEVTTYKSLDLFVNDCENRNIVCDRVIITEQALNSADKVGSLQLIKDYLDVHYMAIQIIVILRSVDILAACTDICYDVETSVVFCSATMKTNFLSALPVKSIPELRSAYSMYLYQKEETAEEDLPAPIEAGDNDYAYYGADEYADTEDYADIDTDGFEESYAEFVDSLDADESNTETYMNATGYDAENDSGEFGAADYSDMEEFDNGYEDNEYMGDADGGFDDIIDAEDDYSGVEIDDYLPDGDAESYLPDEGDNIVGSNSESTNGSSEIDDMPDDGLPADYDIGAILQSYDEMTDSAETNAVSEKNKQSKAAKSSGIANIRNKRIAVPMPEQNTTEKSVVTESSSALANANAKHGKSIFKQKQQAKSVSVPVNMGANTSATNMNTKYAQMMNGQTCGLIVITGDRRAGATTFALQVANHFAQRTHTLYVDLDLVRRGSLFSLSIENLVRCGPATQNGLGAVRVGGKVAAVAYKPPDFSFDALVSLPNFNLADETIKQLAIQLLYQQEYNAVVIDCPFEHLHLISDILSTASVYICLCGDIGSCAGTIFALDALNPVNKTSDAEKANCLTEKDIAMVYRGRYVVTGAVTEEQVMRNMKYLEGIYGLGSESLNWAAMSIAGTKDRIDYVLQNIV